MVSRYNSFAIVNLLPNDNYNLELVFLHIKKGKNSKVMYIYLYVYTYQFLLHSRAGLKTEGLQP